MDSRPEIARAAAEAAARQSYGKLVAWLAARTRDVAAAEDALADAFAAALERWPRSGVPEKPEAWLLAVARRRRVDAVRRRLTSEAGRDHLKLIAEEAEARMTDEDLPDERLRLMFACAHPAIEPGVRAPLILQTILGFDAVTIASAFLLSPATMGQRLVRAKSRIRETGIPFRVPERAELGERLDAVLEAIYAAFAEGWSDPTGTETRHRNLATEGIWLGRLVASLLPDEPEALGLLSLMLFAEARRAARRDTAGDYVPLAEQDHALWDHVLVDEAEACLRGAAAKGVIGRYQLEAAVQSVHAARRLTGRTDWIAIRELYDALFSIAGSPVVAINRAVAIAETEGAVAGLAALYVLGDDKRLNGYQPYWAARAGLLARLGQGPQAVEAYDRAIGLERDPAVRRFLQEKRGALIH
ncbi:RNA polymerase sigma factor [Mesorhizobium sp. M8A.F.Ca.ET.207.01.1.1]|uniref:RNA polymerase sigma factor n=1 Tax=Mesorhizobium sp. M8A.F.Ca.ET.207.01.1.1 TaxID=2563968 RepID=UPI00109C2458|nr:RNA polymerase sigma factor [Mesorhizobium sp. M8A.F.Ca.ET.207.01.1.1]TGQ81038.1 RNA polymerase sigma factor [Mesorhizobium sp. M8A.F.Ca.ET.207.01.1.1]